MTKVKTNLYTSDLAEYVKQAAFRQNRFQELVAYDESLQTSIDKQMVEVMPLYASLAVNFFCNSKCQYCGIWKRSRVEPSLDQLFGVVDQLSDLGVFIIGLTGGEPALSNWLPQLISHIRSRDIFVQALTNGSLLQKERLRQVTKSGLNAILLSLDTLDPERYHQIRGVPLAPLLARLQEWLDTRDSDAPWLGINCVISKLNHMDIVPLIEWCTEMGISIGFQPLHRSFDADGSPGFLRFGPEDAALADGLIHQILSMQKQGYLINNEPGYLSAIPAFLLSGKLPPKFVCKTGYTTVVIDHDQNVKTCWSMPPIGNLNVEGLPDIWNSERSQWCRERMLHLDCPKCWTRAHTELEISSWFGDLSGSEDVPS